MTSWDWGDKKKLLGSDVVLDHSTTASKVFIHQPLRNFHPSGRIMLTCIKQLSHTEVADCKPHNRGFIKMCAHVMGKRQLVSKFIEHFWFFTPPTPGCISRLLFSTFRANPTKINTISKSIYMGKKYHENELLDYLIKIHK